MQSVNLKKVSLDIIDKGKSIPDAHLISICKVNKKNLTCRYIGMNHNGFVCMKHTVLKSSLDQMVIDKTIIAEGDNCNGI
jgi:hypothetical protein